MNCDEAILLISARIDGEPSMERPAVLDAHLAECEACRLTLAELESQDAALMRAFVPRQQAAFALAGTIAQVISPDATDKGQRGAPCYGAKRSTLASFAVFRRLKSTAALAAAMAAGFLAATVIMRPARSRTADPPVALYDAPAAHLALATGEVFACPSGQNAWRPMSPGAAIDVMDAVRTADAKCELELLDGSRLRLNADTEARFTSGRTVSVSTGELWSAVPSHAAQLCISAGQTCVTAGGTRNDQVAEFDVTRMVDTATVTVQHGTADVAGNSPRTTVHAGQVLRAPAGPDPYACTAALHRELAPAWQDDLLVLKPGGDPEVGARVEQLLRCISATPATAETPCTTEQDVRARGQAWCTPFACYIQSKQSGDENRRTAARLLADLAPPSRIPDLISLLDDADGQVRYHASVALRRLTGQTLGYPPERCSATQDPAAAIAWHEWWAQNGSRYSGGK